MEHNIHDDQRVTLFDICKKALFDGCNWIAVEHYYFKGREICKQSISYNHLNDASAKVAEVLVKISGNTSSVVGILVAPCVELIACILGVVRAKNIFVPLETSPSDQLLEKMICCVKMKYILILGQRKNQVEKVFKKFGYSLETVLEFKPCEYTRDLALFQILQQSQVSHRDEECLKLNQRDIAYILHTSGTTGTPKVIAVPHACIIPNIVHLAKIFDASNSSKIALTSPPTFDPSIVEMFMSLANRATLVVPSEEIKMDPVALLEVLFRRAEVTILQATPALMKRFSVADLRSVVFAEDSSLAVMAFGGEACPSYQTIKRWINPACLKRKTLPSLFYNVYGITEVSSWATCYKLPEEAILGNSEARVPLGYPLWKTRLQVKEESSNSVLWTCDFVFKHEDEVSNHLSLGCRWDLAQGELEYAGKPLKFSGKLYIGGIERLCYILGEKDEEFRDSGDLVSVVVSDKTIQLDYLGRSDTIVKKYGKKLSLHLLSEKMSQIPQVGGCCILTNAKENGDLEIIAFLVQQDANVVEENPEAIEETFILTSKQSKAWTFNCFKALSEHLNTNILPDRIFEISMLPITLHGKVNANLLRDLYLCLSNNPNAIITEKDLTDAVVSLVPRCISRNDGIDIEFNFQKTFAQQGGDSFSAVLLINWIDVFLDVSITERVPNVLDLLWRYTLEDFCKIFVQRFNNLSYLQKKSEVNRRRKESCKLLPVDQSGVDRGNAKPEILSISRSGSYHVSDQTLDAVRNKRMKKCKYAKGSFKISEIWRHNSGKCIDASPLVTYSSVNKGKCFIGSHSRKFCAVSLRDGKAIWNVQLPDRIESSACIYRENDRHVVIFGCYDGSVYCLLALSGELWWKFQTGGVVKSSPSWARGVNLVFVGSHDGFLYALSIRNKTCQWRSHCGGGAIFSSPATLCCHEHDQRDLVFVATLGGNLICFAAKDGEKIWRHNIKKPVFSSPCANLSGVCVGCVDCFVYFFSLEGDLLWSFQTGQPIFSSPCFSLDAKSILIGSHDGYLYKLSTDNGSLTWRTRDEDQKAAVYSSPFPVNAGDNGKGLVIFATTTGILYIVNEDSGEIVAKKRLPGEIFSSPVVHTVIKNENQYSESFMIAIGCRDDNLYCLSVTDCLAGALI